MSSAQQDAAPRKRKMPEPNDGLFETSLIGAALLEQEEDNKSEAESQGEPPEVTGNCRYCDRRNLRRYACTTCRDISCCVCVVWHLCGDRWLPCCYHCLMCPPCGAEHDMANQVVMFRAWRREQRTCTACSVTQPAPDAHKNGFRLCSKCEHLFCQKHITYHNGNIRCMPCTLSQ